ncbi:MAG: DUF2867 domain-containing protein [Ornithinimicrobium sp.]|nr:DUF2867 domain-containing protein [Ornithinimicrobium sp.]
MRDRHTTLVAASAAGVWSEVERIGGATGWHIPSVVWEVRGVVDRALGGPGHTRWRGSEPLAPGVRVDSWVVEGLAHTRTSEEVVLRSLMKLPGTALLLIGVEDGPRPDTSWLKYTVLFTPSGLLGVIYWAVSWPAHVLVFWAMHQGLARAAERCHREGGMR